MRARSGSFDRGAGPATSRVVAEPLVCGPVARLPSAPAGARRTTDPTGGRPARGGRAFREEKKGIGSVYTAWGGRTPRFAKSSPALISARISFVFPVKGPDCQVLSFPSPIPRKRRYTDPLPFPFFSIGKPSPSGEASPVAYATTGVSGPDAPTGADGLGYWVTPSGSASLRRGTGSGTLPGAHYVHPTG